MFFPVLSVSMPDSNPFLHTKTISPHSTEFRGQSQQVMDACNNFLSWTPYSVPGLGFISYSILLFSKYTPAIFVI